MRSTRRDALKAIGVTAAVAGLVTVPAVQAKAALGAKRAAPKGKAPGSTLEAASWLAELDGARFAGCLVHRVGPVEHGGVTVTMSDQAGDFFVVDILRHDPATPGVAHAGSLAVYMRIDGRARDASPTREEHGLAAMALALELGRREASGLAAPALLTLTERATVRRPA